MSRAFTHHRTKTISNKDDAMIVKMPGLTGECSNFGTEKDSRELISQDLRAVSDPQVTRKTVQDRKVSFVKGGYRTKREYAGGT